jgi:GAF domain-containing protein
MHEQLEPTEAWSHLARIVVSNLALNDLLEQVAALAKRAIPDIAETSVTLIDGDHAYSAAFTGPIALSLDERQYEAGYGPCLDAADSGLVIQIADTLASSDYPAFAKQAAAQGIRNTLSVGLPVNHGMSGALNMYATDPGRFDSETVEVAKTFATYAAVALANTSLYESAVALSENLRRAMDSRGVIEQAKGILIAERRCDAEEAFRVLSRMSQESNRKLRDIAVELVRDRGQPRQDTL